MDGGATLLQRGMLRCSWVPAFAGMTAFFKALG
jgi:hypothetical protein